MAEPTKQTVALIGLGTIGLSFAAMHLKHTDADVRLFDIREDLEHHITSLLPVYLSSQGATGKNASVQDLISSGRITLCSSVEDACSSTTIVQEQGPENIAFKKATWALVTRCTSPTTHLWTSTSGILASKQVEDLEDKSRLLVVHPFNPPHLTPLIEIVPSPYTHPRETQFALDYINRLDAGYRPVVIKKEITGFVGNRLAFALFREACYLVVNDVVTVKDLDAVMEASHGPRWAVAGPFKLWNFGGGAGGLGAFIQNLGGTMQACWDDAGMVSLRGTPCFPQGAMSTDVNGLSGEGWASKVVRQTKEAYGLPTPESVAERDADLTRVFEAQPRR
ncbi:hypothetical protein CDV31_015062 [Fusarium ambrosium]|uniref:3-hydroxyacyl-CoA dehydrogenase NAD binding domain-containing protein n=1 Tax=Fusarium ambrosium TaxID=131363 RepID=A0A428SS83_9HYPO|nr:hypothetical protein CDV31_015062 [Fusarium ambrosium]